MHQVPDMAPVFAALGDSTRLVLVSRLQDGSEKSVSTLTQGLTLTRQGVSRHLKVLESAGVIAHKRIGRETRYRLEVDVLNNAKSYLERASAQWDEAIIRLSQQVEG